MLAGPAKSGKWHKCHSRKCLDYAEICQHKLNKTKEIYGFFQHISGHFGKFFTFWKSFIENYNKSREAFDCSGVFPQNLQHKGDISFDFNNKKNIVVMISCDLSVHVFFAEIPYPQKAICGSLRTVGRSDVFVSHVMCHMAFHISCVTKSLYFRYLFAYFFLFSFLFRACLCKVCCQQGLIIYSLHSKFVIQVKEYIYFSSIVHF